MGGRRGNGLKRIARRGRCISVNEINADRAFFGKAVINRNDTKFGIYDTMIRYEE